MILPALIAVLCLGGFAAWFSERRNPGAPRWVAIITLVIEALLVVGQYTGTEHIDILSTSMSPAWLADFYRPWIPRFGIGFHLGCGWTQSAPDSLDGLAGLHGSQQFLDGNQEPAGVLFL